MKSSWTREVLAIFNKEARVEWRNRTGFSTSGVFGFGTVVTIALALFNKNPNSLELHDVCAALIWVVVLFAGLLSLPRTFLGEEDQKTADLLRLTARPHAVFWGKTLFNLVQMWALCAIVSTLFILWTGIRVLEYPIFIGTLLCGSAAVVGAVSICGAIASQAANRAVLAATIALPLVLIPIQWGVTGVRESFEPLVETGGWNAVIGLFGYATLSIISGPWIYAAIWKV